MRLQQAILPTDPLPHFQSGGFLLASSPRLTTTFYRTSELPSSFFFRLFWLARQDSNLHHSA